MCACVSVWVCVFECVSLYKCVCVGVSLRGCVSRSLQEGGSFSFCGCVSVCRSKSARISVCV